MGADYVLELRDVCKSYPGVEALKEVNLAVRPGEIHCLVGENGSGKSTLIRCIAGVERPDSGEIIIHGKDIPHLTANQAIWEGIQVIYQDLSLFPDLTVAENIAFSWTMHNGGSFVTASGWRKVADRAMSRLQISLDPDELVEDLSMSEKQIVAIARAMVLDAKLLILDEPTTALTKREIDTLLAIIEDLKTQNVATIFVSHKLDEVFRVADNITVLRDGRKIGDFNAKELDERSLAFHMTGRTIMYKSFEPQIAEGKTLLEVRNLTRRPHFENVSFAVHSGEIVGLTGPLGAGRTELALALFGLNRPQSGEILYEGKPVRIGSPRKARDLGIALLPEDRRAQGLFSRHPIGENLVASILDKLRRLVLLMSRDLKRTSTEWFERLRVKAPSTETLTEALSGGNQQRVVLGKWLATDPGVFILDSPTVGIDVGSKSEIHEKIQALAHEGMGVLLISDEIPEVYHNSNRVIVMRDGQIVTVANVAETTEEALRSVAEGRIEP